MSQPASSAWTLEERIKTALKIIDGLHEAASFERITSEEVLAFANQLRLILMGKPEIINLRLAEIMKNFGSPTTSQRTDFSHAEIVAKQPGRTTYRSVTRTHIRISSQNPDLPHPNGNTEEQT